jgi:two-component system, cell cycle response regulator
MPKKILSVDDSKTVRLIVRKALKPYACDLCEAQNGEEGLAVAKREKPDLILLDVTMPVMDGVEMLTQLKSDPELKGIPVVMLTAEAGRENILKIAKIGVRDYIVKPFKEDVLVEKISRIMQLEPAGTASMAPLPADIAADQPVVHLVEDKPAIVQQILDAVKKAPWVWHHLSNPTEALEAAKKRRPAAVLISLSYPADAAISLLRTFRADAALAATPFLGMAVKTAEDEQQRAIESGFQSIVKKPIDPAELESRLRRALRLESNARAVELTAEHLFVRIHEAMTVPQLDVLSAQFEEKTAAAVDSGVANVVFDLTAVATFSVDLLRFLIHGTGTCQKLGLRTVLLGSPSLAAASRTFDESKDWQFHESLELAIA